MKPRTRTPFETFLMEEHRLQYGSAHVIYNALHSLVAQTSVEDVLSGDLDALVAAHPTVAKAEAERRKAWKSRHRYRHAGQCFREFVAAGGEAVL